MGVLVLARGALGDNHGTRPTPATLHELQRRYLLRGATRILDSHGPTHQCCRNGWHLVATARQGRGAGLGGQDKATRWGAVVVALRVLEWSDDTGSQRTWPTQRPEPSQYRLVVAALCVLSDCRDGSVVVSWLVPGRDRRLPGSIQAMARTLWRDVSSRRVSEVTPTGSAGTLTATTRWCQPGRRTLGALRATPYPTRRLAEFSPQADLPGVQLGA